MYNKRMFKKVADHKLLHKIGKKWVVMSTVALGLVGGGALTAGATHAASVTPAQTATQVKTPSSTKQEQPVSNNKQTAPAKTASDQIAKSTAQIANKTQNQSNQQANGNAQAKSQNQSNTNGSNDKKVINQGSNLIMPKGNPEENLDNDLKANLQSADADNTQKMSADLNIMKQGYNANTSSAYNSAAYDLAGRRNQASSIASAQSANNLDNSSATQSANASDAAATANSQFEQDMQNALNSAKTSPNNQDAAEQAQINAEIAANRAAADPTNPVLKSEAADAESVAESYVHKTPSAQSSAQSSSAKSASASASSASVNSNNSSASAANFNIPANNSNAALSSNPFVALLEAQGVNSNLANKINQEIAAEVDVRIASALNFMKQHNSANKVNAHARHKPIKRSHVRVLKHASLLKVGQVGYYNGNSYIRLHNHGRYIKTRRAVRLYNSFVSGHHTYVGTLRRGARVHVLGTFKVSYKHSKRVYTRYEVKIGRHICYLTGNRNFTKLLRK